MNLAQAIRFSGKSAVALVGSGGKTTALFQLARQLKPPVVVSTTTHLSHQQASFADLHIKVFSEDDLKNLDNSTPAAVILVTGDSTRDGRLAGLQPDLMRKLFRITESRDIPLLIEADGSRLKPLKAPEIHEPSIPDFVSLVVLIAGMSGLGKPLSPDWVHRPERFAEISGLRAGDIITPDAIERVLTSPEGGLKGIPEGRRCVVLLNQADSIELQAQAQRIAVNLLNHYFAVCVASLGLPDQVEVSDTLAKYTHPAIYAVHERIAGIVLAAGGSRRFGKPKQGLKFRGKSFIDQVISTARMAGLSPVILVSGAYHDQIINLVDEGAAQVLYNPDWASGQATSVRAGLSALDPRVGGVVFLLVDQPQIPETLIRALVELHASTLDPIVAPMVKGQRANPVLFDRVTFLDFASLHGDQGGRSLFARYPIRWLEWQDESILLDVDSPEEYQRLLRLK